MPVKPPEYSYIVYYRVVGHCGIPRIKQVSYPDPELDQIANRDLPIAKPSADQIAQLTRLDAQLRELHGNATIVLEAITKRRSA